MATVRARHICRIINREGQLGRARSMVRADQRRPCPRSQLSGATEENSRVMLSAAKWGALVGVAIYVLSQIITIVGDIALGANTPADPSHPGKIALGCLNLLLIAFAFSTSGFYAGRETRQAGYGAIAGMVTFVVYGALLTIYTIGGRAQQSGATLGQQIVIDLITVVFFLGIAALIGWLGGRPGSSQGRARASRAAKAQEQREQSAIK